MNFMVFQDVYHNLPCQNPSKNKGMLHTGPPQSPLNNHHWTSWMLRWRDWTGMATCPLSFFSMLSHVSSGQWTQLASPGPLSRPFSPLPQLSSGSASIVPQPTPSHRCASTATGLNGNGRFNGTGTAVAPVSVAASAGSRCSCC